MKRFVLLGLAFLLGSCADSGTATDNTVWSSRKLVRVDSLLDSTVAPTATAWPLLLKLDSSNFDFSKAKADGSDLRILRLDSTPVPFTIRNWDPQTQCGGVWIRLDSVRAGSNPDLILAWGNPRATTASNPAQTWAGIPDSVVTQQTSILVTDFEDGTGRIFSNKKRAFWASRSATTVPFTSPGTGTDVNAGIKDSGIYDAKNARLSKALQMKYTATGSEWVLVGTLLGTQANSFVGLDSITLWLRGTGVARVALENNQIANGAGKAWLGISPTPVWKQYTIKPSDFDAPAGNAVGWTRVRDSVTTFTIFGIKGGDFWIDDIRFHGMNLSEIR
jgi:hypothetical protein